MCWLMNKRISQCLEPLHNFIMQLQDLLRPGDEAMLIACLPSMQETLCFIPSTPILGIMAHICNPSVCEVKTGGSEVQSLSNFACGNTVVS